MNAKPTLQDVFRLVGFPPDHKHESRPPPEAKIVDKWGGYPGDFEKAVRMLGALRAKPLGKAQRYDLYYWQDSDGTWYLALAKEKIITADSTRGRR